jgi:hypothetical protein
MLESFAYRASMSPAFALPFGEGPASGGRACFASVTSPAGLRGAPLQAGQSTLPTNRHAGHTFSKTCLRQRRVPFPKQVKQAMLCSPRQREHVLPEARMPFPPQRVQVSLPGPADDPRFSSLAQTGQGF